MSEPLGQHMQLVTVRYLSILITHYCKHHDNLIGIDTVDSRWW